MKTFSKILSLSLAGVMALSTAAMAKNPFHDVPQDASYTEAVTMLNDLNILIGYEEDGGFYFKPDQTITRAETAKVIVGSLGFMDAAKASANLNLFRDVDSAHWAAGYVNHIAGYNNIIAGYGDGTFGPSDEVLYEQVLKMVVCALGYYPMAMQRGGYPSGFLAVASELGLTKGASGNIGEPAKRSVVARIIYNALDVPMMKQISWDAQNPEYIITGTGDHEKETLLEDHLDVVRIDGIVSETFYQQENPDKENLSVTISDLNEEDASALFGDSDTREITIGIGSTDAALHHGYAVTAYVYTDEDSAEKKLLAIAPRSARNTANTFSLSDLAPVKDSAVNEKKGFITLSYEDADGNTHSFKVDKNAVFYENMDEKSFESLSDIKAYFAGDMASRQGRITLVQNETQDNYADYVFVEFIDRPEYVITGLNENKKRITFEYMDGSARKTGNEVLDDESEDGWVFFIRDGEEIGFNDLKEGDVVSKISNKAGSVIKAYVTSDTLEGKITSVNEDKKTVTISGNRYDFSDISFDTSNIGDSGIFYLNQNGQIIFFDRTENKTSQDDFAYLFAAAAEENTWGTSTKVTIRVLDADGTWNEYELAQKVIIANGASEEKTADTEEFLAKASSLTNGMIAFEDGKFTGNGGIMQYKVNSNGKVSHIMVPHAELSSDYLSYLAFEEDYSEEDNTLGKIDIAEDAVIFTVQGGDSSEEDNIKVSSLSSVFSDGDTYSGVYYVTEDNETDMASALLVNTRPASVKQDASFFIVSEATQTENKEGEAQEAIIGYQNGSSEPVTIFLADDAMLHEEALAEDAPQKGEALSYTDLKEGDVIAYAVNESGEICELRRLISSERVLSQSAGFANTYKDVEDQDVEILFGFAAEKGTTKTGISYIDLSAHAFDDETETDNVEMIGRLRENKLDGSVYYAHLSAKNFSISASDNFDDISAANIRIKNDATVKGGEGHFVYAKLVDGEIIDAVVFIVDCAEFDLNQYK